MNALSAIHEHEKNEKWLDENYNRIVDKHDGKYVAVWKKTVVASGETIEEVKKAVEANSELPSASNVVIEYISREPQGMLM